MSCTLGTPELREVSSDGGRIGLVTDSIYQQYIWYYSEYSDQRQDFSAVDTTDIPVFYDLLDGSYYVSIVDSNGCQAESDILGITISPIDGVDFYDIKIFPNPASDHLAIKTSRVLPNVNIEIYDNKGQMISNLNSTLPGTISLQNIPSGIFFLKFTAGQKYFVAKVMKK